MDQAFDSVTDWNASGEAELADIVTLRRAIHADPEIGLHCPRTTEKLRAALAGLPLEISESKTTTGFIAVLRGGAASANVTMAAPSCCAATWTRCRCRRRRDSTSPRKRKARCTHAGMTRIRPCWSVLPAHCAPNATS